MFVILDLFKLEIVDNNSLVSLLHYVLIQEQVKLQPYKLVTLNVFAILDILSILHQLLQQVYVHANQDIQMLLFLL